MVCKVITLIVILPNKMKIIKQNSWRRISQSEIRNSAAAESEGGQKFLPPNPLPFCPPERSVWRAKRAISFVQKRFDFRQTPPPKPSLQEFCRVIQPREARQRTKPLARRARRGSPSAGSKSLTI